MDIRYRMKVLIITPSYRPEVTGNAVTADRLYRGLTQKGVDALVLKGNDTFHPDFRPDIIHALHAGKGGIPALNLAEKTGARLVVTITGTDIMTGSDNLNEDVKRVFRRADRVITYHQFAKARLLDTVPSLDGRIEVIRPSVSIKESKVNNTAGFNLVLPAGIRRVKDPSFAILPLVSLKQSFPLLNLGIVGPVLEEEEWKRIEAIMAGKDWISHRIAPHEEMPLIYGAADVVLNTSVSEGLSNAVLEAMSLGKAVLASDCEGNRAVIDDGSNGLLFRQGDQQDFIDKAGRLLSDPSLRQRLGDAAREKIRRDYSIDEEMDRHLELYEKLLQQRISGYCL